LYKNKKVMYSLEEEAREYIIGEQLLKQLEDESNH
jgi:hypothetical protein